MGNHHALGGAGGTGGIHNISRVGIHGGVHRAIKSLFVFLTGSQGDIIQKQRIRQVQALEFASPLFIGDNAAGPEVLEGLLGPVGRGGIVQRCVGRAAVEGGIEADNAGAALGQVNGHRAALFDAVGQQRRSGNAGRSAQGLIGNFTVAVLQGDGLGQLSGGALQQADNGVHGGSPFK